MNRSEIDGKWAAVVKRRLAELRSGAVPAAPGDKVFEKIWARLEKGRLPQAGADRAGTVIREENDEER